MCICRREEGNNLFKPVNIIIQNLNRTVDLKTQFNNEYTVLTFANFVIVIISQQLNPQNLLVNTNNPCQNAIVRSQRVKFSADLAHSQKFFTSKIF